MPLLVPNTTWDPLGPIEDEPLRDGHDVLCFHTMVGPFDVVDRMFHENGYRGTESDLGVRADGFTKQWTDLMRQADANLYGNHHVISIENEDMGPAFPAWSGSDVPAFTDAQIRKLIELGSIICRKEFHVNCPSTWACHQVGIPPVVIKDTCGKRGIGWHRQGIDSYPDLYRPGWRQQGCEKWSDKQGKVCPGDRRIGQIINRIVPGIAANLRPSIPLENDMPVLISSAGRPVRLVVGEKAIGISDSESVEGFHGAGVKTAPVTNRDYDRIVESLAGPA